MTSARGRSLSSWAVAPCWTRSSIFSVIRYLNNLFSFCRPPERVCPITLDDLGDHAEARFEILKGWILVEISERREDISKDTAYDLGTRQVLELLGCRALLDQVVYFLRHPISEQSVLVLSPA